MDYTMTGEGATGAPAVPALDDFRDALDELIGRAEDLDGVSDGTHHALEQAAEALKSDHSAVQAVMAARAARLGETFDPRAGFLFDEEGDGDDDLETLSHDLDALAIQSGDLVGRGLLSGSTRALLDHAAHSLRADLAAADASDGETVQASEWDDEESGEEAEGENPDLWPDADSIARRRYGVSLDAFKLTDPDIMQRLLYEAEANRHRRV